MGGMARGGPGSPDPERITYLNVTIQRLLLIAYAPEFDPISFAAHGMDFDQISGPDWISPRKSTTS